MRKGYLKEIGDHLYVGAKDEDPRYEGPQADVYIDGTWLYIVTDDYEGAAMLNIEALPFLRKALAKITRKTTPPIVRQSGGKA